MEKLILCLFGFFAVSQGHVINGNIGSRIVNGTAVKAGEIPFQVSLQAYKLHFCGGSILNANYVITAAHCVEDWNPTSISIIAGTVFYKEPHQKRQSSSIIVHEGFSSGQTDGDDIALIKVDFPFEFSKLVQPVLLPDFHAKIATNSTAVVSGWGSLGGPNDEVPDQLQKAQIWIADQEYCVNVMKKQRMTICLTHICANDPNSRRGQCNGDSGGPLIVDGKLTGIVSWSIKDPYCASTEYPGVYTRVPEYVDWIVEHAV